MTTTPATVRLPVVTGPEYLRVAFSAKAAGVTISPTSGEGFLTFFTDPDLEPAAADATWATALVVAAGSGIIAKTLIGAGTGFTFTKGQVVYAWLKWVDDPEIIIRRADNKIRFE